MNAKRFWRPNDRLADQVLEAFLAQMVWPEEIEAKPEGWAQLALQCLEGLGREGVCELRALGIKAPNGMYNPDFTGPIAKNLERGAKYYAGLGWLCVSEESLPPNWVSLVHDLAGALAKLPETEWNQLRSFCI